MEIRPYRAGNQCESIFREFKTRLARKDSSAMMVRFLVESSPTNEYSASMAASAPAGSTSSAVCGAWALRSDGVDE